MRFQRLALFGILLVGLLRTAAAQESDIFGMFGAMRRSGISAAAQADWERIPDSEVACVDRTLQEKGSSINDVIRQGIAPSDRRVAGLRAACNGAEAASSSQTPFVIDGLRLGGHVAVGSASYLEYHCDPSGQFAGFTSCQRRRTENSPRGPYLATTTLLHASDGTVLYISRFLEPTFFNGREAMDGVRRLSGRYGQPHFMPTLNVANGPGMLMAYWGDVVLEPLDRAQLDDLTAGRDMHAGLLIDPLGNFQQSATLGLPVYRLTGGAGYVWAANWDRSSGRGTLRFLAVDASRFSAPIAAPGDGNANANAATADPTQNGAAGTPPQTAETPRPAPTPLPTETATSHSASPPSSAVRPSEPVQNAQHEPVAAPAQPKSENKAEAPAAPRTVGPPLVNRTASADPNAASHDNFLSWLLVGAMILLLGAAGLLLLKKRKRSMPPSVPFTAPAMAGAEQVKVTIDDAPVVPLADIKQDPAHEIKIEPVLMTEAGATPAAEILKPTVATDQATDSETAGLVGRQSTSSSA